MIALIHIYCSTSLCVIYKSLLIHDIQVLIYRGSTNERLPGEGVAHDGYYNETDRVITPNYIEHSYSHWVYYLYVHKTKDYDTTQVKRKCNRPPKDITQKPAANTCTV